MHNLAATLGAQGDRTAERRLQERVLEVRTRVLGEEHPDTLASMSNLAVTLNALGDLEGAIRLLRKCLRAAQGPRRGSPRHGSHCRVPEALRIVAISCTTPGTLRDNKT